MKLAVFCSCSEGLSPLFFSEMEQLGESLAADGHEIIYGGSNKGCMGALARGVLREGGRLVGVIPRLDFMEGTVQDGLAEVHTVTNLSARKEVMNRLAEAFVVFPGGLGTLDEAFEVLVLKGCGSFAKPIIFYNFLSVWTPFLDALTLLREQGLVRQTLPELLHVLDNAEALREYLKHAL